VGDRAIIGGQSGVTKDVRANTVVSGYPARDHDTARRLYAHTAMLPELFKRLKELERRVRELEGGEDRGPPTTNRR
jgi:UDP-3-O-[3-hydroxymyristoyl] glucosamine N-acyltransferase